MDGYFAGKDALILFFGIIWGIILSTVGRYRLFDTHLFFSHDYRCYAICRFIVGFIILNIMPLIWFYLLYTYVVSDQFGAIIIMSSAFSSISLFGFNRILHAIIATDGRYSRYYSDNEQKTILAQWGRSGPNTFRAHFLPGIAYLVLIPLISKMVILIFG
jgi:hypothetical protein